MLGFTKNLVFPEPEPPITRMFLFLAYFGFFGLLDIVRLSVSVRIILFSNSGSAYGRISFSVPHEAFCQVLFRVIDATYALFSTIKPHAVIHGAVGLWLKWRSGKVARYLGFATWILPFHFLRA